MFEIMCVCACECECRPGACVWVCASVEGVYDILVRAEGRCKVQSRCV